jgi:hypothetical protein
MVDMLDSKSSAARRVGSSPTSGTKQLAVVKWKSQESSKLLFQVRFLAAGPFTVRVLGVLFQIRESAKEILLAN